MPSELAAKDISALNRALVDRDSGLFADVDVTLLPEVLTLPLTLQPTLGDSDAFALSSDVAVAIKDFNGSQECRVRLVDPASGKVLDFADLTTDAPQATFRHGTAQTAYIYPDACGVQVVAQP